MFCCPLTQYKFYKSEDYFSRFVVDVARGHCSLDNIDETLKGSDEAAQQVHAAPACGLTLSKVEYKILAC